MAEPGHRCARCGASLTETTVGGLCPACVLARCLEPNEIPQTDGVSVDAAFLERHDLVMPVATSAASARVFGDYEIGLELGRGGMGVVYRARQVSLHRAVAIKMILAGPLASRDFVERFYTEAEAAASLDHPNIVPIYEVGEHQGQPFYSMRLVEGLTLARAVKDGPMEPRRAATLLQTVAQAVHYAHQRGVLHRDLKPANILLDAAGEPHVTDFGLAKLVEGEATLTLSSTVLGTPAYMSPEQASGKLKELTTAADVYSLGAVLFEVLTGRVLFQGDTPLETILKILDREPDRPRTLNPRVDRDLETICLKCLQKEPERRYASAQELAEDLERWLTSRPIRARPVSLPERTWLWCRRKPALAGLTGALILTVIVSSGVALWRIAAAREAEQRETYYASVERASRYIRDGDIDRALPLLLQCPERFRHWEWGHLVCLCHQDIVSIRAHTHAPAGLDPVATAVHGVYVSMIQDLGFDPSGTWLITRGADGQLRVWLALEGRRSFEFGGTTNRVTSWASHPRASQLAVGTADGIVRFFEVATWRETGSLAIDSIESASDSGEPAATVEATILACHPDGDRLAIALSDRRVVVVELPQVQQASATERRGPGHFGPPAVPAGSSLAAGRTSEFPNVSRLSSPLRPETGRAPSLLTNDETPRIAFLLTNQTAAVEALFFTRDGQRLVVKEQLKIRQFETRTGRAFPPFELSSQEYERLFVDPTGGHIAAIDRQERLRLWSGSQTGAVLGIVRGAQPASVRWVLFSPDSRLLCTGGDHGTARVYRVDTGEEVLSIPDRVYHAAFSPDGDRVLGVGAGRQAGIWDTARGRRRLTLQGHRARIDLAAFSPDGRLAATASRDGMVKVWSARPGRDLLQGEGMAGASAISPDGRKILWGTPEGPTRIWDADSGQPLVTLRSRIHWPFDGTFAADGRRLLTVGNDKAIRIWDAETGAYKGALRDHQDFVMPLRCSRDGRWIASGDNGGTIKTRDATTGRVRFTFTDHTGPVSWLEFDPQGRKLVSTAFTEPHRVWDVETGRLLFVLDPGPGLNVMARFTPDGKRIVTANEENRLRIWDAKTGRLVGQWVTRSPSILFSFSPDGKRMAAPVADSQGFGSDVGMVEIWDLEHGRQILQLQGHDEVLDRSVFSPNGRRILTTSFDSTARQWESFPWHDEELPGSAREDLKDRLRAYACTYWQERLEAEKQPPSSELRTPSSQPDPEADFWPPRDPQADPRLLDLTPHYTSTLQMAPGPADFTMADDDFRELPQGIQVFGGIPFDVRGVVTLSHWNASGGWWQRLADQYPKRVDGIRVGRAFRKLRVLQAATGVAGIPDDGAPIANLVLHSADGSKSEIEIVYGRDLRDWSVGEKSSGFYPVPSERRLTSERSQVVWEGSNPICKRTGAKVRLYLTTYENPRPDVEITHIDYVSKMTTASPFIVAMTVEP